MCPLQPNWNFNASVKVKGRVYASKSAEPDAQVRATTAGYYKTYGVRLLKGRFFSDDVDTADTPISVVVNEAL